MPNRSQYSRIAAQLYRDAPYAFRVTQSLRPYICPYDQLMAAIPAESSILDVGCGGGLFIGLLAQAGKIGLGMGIDPNPNAIRVADRMKRRLSLGSKIIFAFVEENDPWPSSRFDVVSIIDVIHHVPRQNQAEFLAKVADRVSPGGILLYKDIAEKPLWRATANRMHDLVMARQWIQYAPLSAVKQWMFRFGFDMEASRTIDMLWYRHEILVLRKPLSGPVRGG